MPEEGRILSFIELSSKTRLQCFAKLGDLNISHQDHSPFLPPSPPSSFLPLPSSFFPPLSSTLPLPMIINMERTARSEVFSWILLAEGWTRPAMPTFQGAAEAASLVTMLIAISMAKPVGASLFLRKAVARREACRQRREAQSLHILWKNPIVEQENRDFWR